MAFASMGDRQQLPFVHDGRSLATGDSLQQATAVTIDKEIVLVAI